MTSAEDVLEFEEQIRLQNETRATSSSKTRVDPDGTVMEWDERRKAWFPKIDEDFIARYQMNYGVIPAEQNAAPNSTSVGWTDFNAQLARLRQEKGEDSEEVRNLTKAAQDALASYYNSPEYREWYEAYCRSKQEDQTQQTVSSKQPAKPAKMKLNNLSLRPAERVLSAFGNTQDDAEAALARAEAEQQAGVPLPLESTAPELQAENKESIQQQEQVTEKDGAAESQASKKRKATAPKPAWYEMDDTKNTHVYVTGLPPDITEKQFAELMSKYGVIMNEPFTNKLRAKLYLDSSGKPKGDGRCCYVKVESVDLALKLLDGMIYSPGYVLHAERAKFQLRGQFDPHKRRRLTLKEKKKLKAQQESLFRWGIDVSKFVRSKKERVVVLKNAFLETDFVHDVTLIPLVREALRAQCAKCGNVKKIVVHDTNPLGVVTVTFTTPEEADTALTFLDKALFSYPGPGGVRQLKAERWDGKTNYSMKEAETEEASRISKWNEYLGGDTSDEEEDEHGNKDSSSTKPPELSANSEHAIPDYWETESQDSSTGCVDTDDELKEGGSSGDETA